MDSEQALQSPDLHLGSAPLPTEHATVVAACSQAALTAGWCASACLAADPGGLATCIDRCVDAAEVLDALAVIGSRADQAPRAQVLHHLAEAALVAAEECAATCEVHQDLHEHCQTCLRSCRVATSALRTLLRSLSSELADPDQRLSAT